MTDIFINLNGDEYTEIKGDNIILNIKYPSNICLCKDDEFIMTNIKSIEENNIKYVINYDELELTTVFIY